MKDQKKEIAEKYLLPERPFLHGIASAFDMFAVLNQGRSEHLLANLQEDARQSERDAVRSAWHDIGEMLYESLKQYETASGRSIQK